MSPETEIERAVHRFYAGFNRLLQGDPGPLEAAWSTAPDVVNMSPLGGRAIGWRRVMQSLEDESHEAVGGSIRCEDLRIMCGGEIATVTCMERGERPGDDRPVEFTHRATLVFRREHSEWKVIHHHTDLEPELAAQPLPRPRVR